jgi:hypothetical protein
MFISSQAPANSPRITTWRIESLADFVAYVERRVNQERYELFRGQDQPYNLVPKIARVPLNRPLAIAEREMFEAFKRESRTILAQPPTNDWEWLSLAQHHGVPTRLLDWTQNPLAALWFAVERKPEGKAPYGVVWRFSAQKEDIVRAYAASPFNGERTQFFEPPFVSARLQAQDAFFSLHRFKRSTGRFVPLDRNKKYMKRLEVIKIPASLFPAIRRALNRCGIHQALLYPGLDGLGRWITARYVPD